MGIRIDGATDLINASDGSLTIEGQSVNTSGMMTASGGLKIGTAATIHSTGQFNIGVAATVFPNGNATFAGIVTATTLSSGNLKLTDDGSASPIVSIQADDATPYALMIGNSTYNTNAPFGQNFFNNNSGEGYFRHIGNGAYLDYHFSLHNNSSNKLCLKFEADDQSVELYAAGSKKFETDPGGTITTGVSTATAFVPTDTSLGNRRVNLNGAMQIWQRSTSASDIGGSNGYFAADRYRSSNNGSGRHTISRDTDEPGGFAYSMKIDVTTAVSSPSAANYMFIQHRLEGQDVQAFAKGTAGAKEYALSFWVKSPKTGVHVVQWEDVENTRSVSGTYTIASANTWEKHSIIFPADTTGAITNDNAHRMQLYFWLFAGSTYNTGSVGDLQTTWASTGATSRASGQVNCFDNTSNNFYITGIQLEVGSSATPFEHVRYDEELSRCKRYFQDWSERQFFANKTSDSTYDGHVVLGMFDLNMRANPTVSPNVVYGRIAGGSGWTDGSNNEAAGIHHDPSSTFPGRWFLLTGTWNWHSGYNDTIAVKFHSVNFSSEL